jgi:GAF domain-containing protein
MEVPRTLDVVTAAVAAIHEQSDALATVEEIVVQAQRCLPEFEHVGLSLVSKDGKLDTLAATTDTTRAFDALQSEAGDGPCVAAAQTDGIVTVRNARHEQRWAPYIIAALRLGLRSQLGVRLHSDPPLCLNLYSTSEDEIDSGSIGVAETFAVHAGIALGHLRTEEQYRTAIGTRTTIGTAVGIVMERHQLTQSEAFAYLVRQSSTQNRKVRLIATDLLQETEQAVTARRTNGTPPQH